MHVGFWVALVVVPVLMFGFGVLMERLLVRWLLALDPLYNFLLTFGLTLVLVEAVKQRYGVSGLPYELPAGLGGQVNSAASTSRVPGLRLAFLRRGLRGGRGCC